MYSIIRPSIRAQPRSLPLSTLFTRQFRTSQRLRDELVTPKVDYETRYAEKLKNAAAKKGLSVEALRLKMKEEEVAKRREKLAAATAQAQINSSSLSTQPQDAGSSSSKASPNISIPKRQDSSPPLSGMLNLDKLVETPHTAEQISLLWRTYHASRSKGTGRGYLCATVPVDVYEKMASVAAKYPYFVIPIPRDGAQIGEAKTSEDQQAYEFYFMEWAFHGSPPEPKPANADLFLPPGPSTNPQTSTILFTPLQEYKQRTTFATPYLVVTNYTEFGRSHGSVLLRGEITPTTSGSIDAGGDGRYMLSQQDAQLLVMGLQKFYLWQDGKGEREKLLKAFHDSPSTFKWEELLKHADFSP
ncbi:ATP11-domain-containing protein [Trametopsis cervina]|nr:ATP11-domain-containing protein [Trametopsis cervina]